MYDSHSRFWKGRFSVNGPKSQTLSKEYLSSIFRWLDLKDCQFQNEIDNIPSSELIKKRPFAPRNLAVDKIDTVETISNSKS